VQGSFLVLFFVLLLWARHPDKGRPSPLLELFFDLDPLILLTTAIAAHAVSALLMLSLITVGLTLVFGRVFCGWICPLGTLNSIVSSFRRADNHVLVSTEQYSPWQRTKYFVLAAVLVMSLFGAQIVGLLDPFSLLYKGSATVLLPAAQYGVEEGAAAVYDANPHLGPLRATAVSEPAYHFLRDNVFVVNRKTFLSSGLILAVFAAVLLLNLYRKRFWCRYLCPLGGLLGLLSRRPLLRLKNDAAQCTNCGLCKVDCQGAAAPDKAGEWQPTECFMCLNCGAKCNWGTISFGLASPLTPATEEPLDLGKRALMTSAGVGVAGMLALRLSPQSQGKVFNPELLRPPGAGEEREFLQRCIRCGICLEACPTNGLQPAFLEAGLEGMWTPRLVPHIGYCEYECNLCGQVCPTQAIEPLALADKQKVKLGLASFDTTRCLPYAYQRECMICEEHCPLPKKAIHFVPTEVLRSDGSKVTVKQPRVDPDLCIGCGICEAKCVFRDRAAIRVRSANESRHSLNQPILPGLPGETNPAPEAPAAGNNNPYG
jgi:MauM/NapG family ferredoxin protein